MSTAAWSPRISFRPELPARLQGRTAVAVARALPVAALTGVALWLRWRALGAPLWIDEGISIGIASHPLTAIPDVLRQDGSPPLYYLLLHLWMQAFGSNPVSAHALSVLISVVAVPAAGWAAWRPFGPRAGILAAALAAFNPFLAYYADEVRMYSLTFLLGALTTGAFLRAFVVGSRRWALGFGVLVALTCLTHGWGLFLAAAAVPAYGLALWVRRGERRALLLDGALAGLVAAVLFAPWVPTLLYQSSHTGAPWSIRPHIGSVETALRQTLDGTAAWITLFVIAGAGVVAAVLRAPRNVRLGLGAAFVLALGTFTAGFLLSHFGQPAWALRYLTVVLGPLLIALAAGLDRAGYAGLIAVPVVCLGLWYGHPRPAALQNKSDVNQLATALGDQLPRGTLIASPQSEQVPVLRYYVGPGYRYVTPLGLAPDPQVADWRDALARLRASTVANTLAPVVDRLAPGQRVLLVQPRFGHPTARWTIGVARRERSWNAWLTHNPQLRLVARFEPSRGFGRSSVGGVLLQRVG